MGGVKIIWGESYCKLGYQPPFKNTHPSFLLMSHPKSAKCPSFLSFTPYYLLKVTKILVNISQFNFLVVTKKNIFAYKLFLSLNISDFNSFFMWKFQPPPLKNVTSLFPSMPPLKVEVLSIHPFLKIWLEVQPPSPSRKGISLKRANTRKNEVLLLRISSGVVTCR